jgi:outer membrane murein-binding lipoprotein Lpp
MSGASWTGILLVGAGMFAVMSLVLFEGLRAKLRAIPAQSQNLSQQIAILRTETETAASAAAAAEEELERLTEQADQAETSLLEARQRLHEVRNRLSTTVYVLDQIIQNSYKAWLVVVRQGVVEETKAGTIEGEWARGRRTLVFAENVANARRRIQARYPQTHGYHIGDPHPFHAL